VMASMWRNSSCHSEYGEGILGVYCLPSDTLQLCRPSELPSWMLAWKRSYFKTLTGSFDFPKTLRRNLRFRLASSGHDSTW